MSIRPIDLRDILEYVPRFRNHIFVLSIDGSIIADKNFDSLLTDIAVLQSLNIRIIICHGIAFQIRELASERNLSYSNDRGEGPTDDVTLKLALDSTAMAASRIMKGLAKQQLPYSFSNAVEGRPIGVENGVDQQHTGVIDSVNSQRIIEKLDRGEIPIFSPIIYDPKGRVLRINSDQLAASIATKLEASKLIYLSSRPKLTARGENILNCSTEELKSLIGEEAINIDPLLLSKAKQAIKVLSSKTERVHILDGRIDGCLLIEIFDKVGLGTMIHANEYDCIRPATSDDSVDIYALVKRASKTNLLRQRTIEEIESVLDSYIVYEVDDSIIGCSSLITYKDSNTVELASICVQPYHQGKGIGKMLALYTIDQAKKMGYENIIALSTRASEFFVDQLGFVISTESTLPAERKTTYAASNRNSFILLKKLKDQTMS